MKLQIRKTNKDEFSQTENLTREVFWNLYRPGCEVHLVLHQLRKSGSYLNELDLIAVGKNQIVGHVLSTKGKIVDSENNSFEVLCVGPVSVLPTFQNKGIGSKLLKHSISEAKRLGFIGMILFGNPDYYHRFGFRNAKKFNISTKEGKNFEPFMALEIQDNGFRNVSGKFFDDKGFTTTENDLIEFEKQFPPKKKGKAKISINI